MPSIVLGKARSEMDASNYRVFVEYPAAEIQIRVVKHPSYEVCMRLPASVDGKPYPITLGIDQMVAVYRLHSLGPAMSRSWASAHSALLGHGNLRSTLDVMSRLTVSHLHSTAHVFDVSPERGWGCKVTVGKHDELTEFIEAHQNLLTPWRPRRTVFPTRCGVDNHSETPTRQCCE